VFEHRGIQQLASLPHHHEPRGGYADPVATTKSFAAAAARLGVRVVTGVPVTGLHSSGVRVSGVDTPAGTISCDTVVLANGAWSAPLLAEVGVDPAIDPVRVQVVRCGRPGWVATGRAGHVTMIDRRNGFYSRPDGDDGTLVGLSAFYTSTEDPDGFDGAEDPEFLALARKLAANRLPGMDEAPRISGRAGVLDVTADGRMILGDVPGAPGLLLAVGMSGTGFKKSPAIGAAMGEFITSGKAETAPIEPFHISRFARGRKLSGREYALPANALAAGGPIPAGQRGLIH
jgi:sarcosine oxidase subunit beta